MGLRHTEHCYSLQIDDSEVMGDALAVWPGSDAKSEVARAVVRGCLQNPDGCAVRGTGGSRMTPPIEGGRLGAFLSSAGHRGLLASIGCKLLAFLREQQQSPFFAVSKSTGGGDTYVSLNLDALRAAAGRSTSVATSYAVLSPSICETSQVVKVCFPAWLCRQTRHIYGYRRSKFRANTRQPRAP